MEIGIFSRTYEHMPLEAIFREMVSQGIRHTQFNLSSAGMDTLPEAMDEEKLTEIRKLADRYGITMDALSGTFNMIDPDEGRREQGCRQFETQCRIARFLDIPIVTLCTGSRHPADKWTWHPDNLTESAWTDQPMSEPVRRAYLDLGQLLHLGGLEAFRQTAGWEIVSKTTPYTTNAFTAPFQEEFNVKNWKKFLLLPSQTPIASLDALRNLHIPVMILANENDFCHPYAYGKLLERTIPKAIFRQVPDKDSDPAEHRQQINLAVRELLGFPCDSAKQ